MMNVLLPLDGSPLAEQAIATARTIAVATKGRLDLVLVHAIGRIAEGLVASRGEEPRTIEDEYIDSVAASIARQSLIDLGRRVVAGDPVEQICASAQQLGSDLIVMTTHGRTGISRAWIGSVADAVIRGSAVPVLLVRAQEGHAATFARPFGNILVTLDGSESATDILAAVIALASSLGARVTLLQVVNPVPLLAPAVVAIPAAYTPALPVVDQALTDAAVSDARHYVTSLAAHIYDRHGVPVDARVTVHERTAQAIFETAVEVHADLVAMTTQGRGLSRLLMGSVADKVLRGTTLPLLVLRPNPAEKLATRDVGIAARKPDDARRPRQHPQKPDRRRAGRN